MLSRSCVEGWNNYLLSWILDGYGWMQGVWRESFKSPHVSYSVSLSNYSWKLPSLPDFGVKEFFGWLIFGYINWWCLRKKQTSIRVSCSSFWVGANILYLAIVLFVWFDSLRPINNLSVINGRVFLGWTSNKLGLMFLLKNTTQWRRWGSNPQLLGLESSTLPLSHCASDLNIVVYWYIKCTCKSKTFYNA